MVDAAIFALCFGVCIMYGCFLGDLFSSLLRNISFVPPAFSTRTSAILGITSLVLLPLCLLRDLSALRFSSMAGIGAVIYVTLFMVVRLFDKSYALGSGRLLQGQCCVCTLASEASLFICKCMLPLCICA